MSLKEKIIQCEEAATGAAINELKESIMLIDPTIDISNLIHAALKNCHHSTEFNEKHCQSTCYGFQVKRCKDSECPFCSNMQPIRLPEEIFDALSFIPDPVLDSLKEHYQSFQMELPPL